MQSLGDRMKRYEASNRRWLTPRSYNILRVDGKAFHTLTRGMNKPFDLKLIEVMNKTALDLCSEVQGAKVAYVQSDEISVLFTDLDSVNTDLWFGGCQNKIESISAAVATEAFNYHFNNIFNRWPRARFDSRVFQLPDPVETHNCFVWRQKDWERNSLQMFARAVYSHKECHGKNTAQLHDMLHKKELNWNNLRADLKRNRRRLDYPRTPYTHPEQKLYLGPDPEVRFFIRSRRENRSGLNPFFKTT